MAIVKQKKALSWIVVLALVFSMVLQPILPVYAEGEVEVLSETFNSYKAAEKEYKGWDLNAIGIYDKATSSGPSGPNSLKFGATGSSLLSPEFNLSGGGNLSFWMKGQSAKGTFLIEALINGTWSKVEEMAVTPQTEAGMKKFPLAPGTTKVRFTYTKSESNVAFDDVKITTTSGQVPEEVPVTGLKVQDKLDLEVGATSLLGVTYTPENTTEKEVIWTSDSPEVATVANGTVTAVKAGTATITVASKANPKVTATCQVTVKEKADVEGPAIAEVKPVSGSTQGNRRPEISAAFHDVTGVDITTVKLILDEKDVTSKSIVAENKVSYVPEADLAEGSHNVKVLLKDTLGNETSKQWSFKVGEVSSNLYFGQLHAHTDISDGTGTLDEAYQWARDKGNADYIAITDHSNWFDNDVKANILDGSASTKWTNAHATADKYNKDNEFTAMYGYEMTWSGSTGGWGHINTFNTPGFETRTNKTMNLKNYYNQLQKASEGISQLNHPGKTFGDFGDFGFYSKATDQLVSLIEVGNGEGPVRGSGYFPSYEYYTRALDKGWHLAPTNNQDNHKRNWITSNTARTVIDAPTLDRDSLYQSMREMKVYATEDSNLRISYTVNDMPMGSNVIGADKLNFKVSITDPDNEDIISKISIIANGGAEVASKTFTDNEVSWDFQLDNAYTYYYVKVDQKDKDIAVTAPVWTADTVAVGISSVQTSSEVAFPNEEINFTATLFNNDSKAYNNVKVEYFLNDTTEKNKIGEQVAASLKPTELVTTVQSYKFNRAGEYTIYARATVNVNGSDKVSTASVKLKVLNKEEIVKVVIDGAHYNQYVTGNYANKINGFKDMLIKNGARVVINEKEITDEVLADTSLLVLTDPQSTNDPDNGLKVATYSDSEIAAIKRFTEKGGNVILTTKADYKDGTGEYSNGIQSNRVLEAIGTNMRVNDDQVIDNTTNEGQAFRLMFTKYNKDRFGLTKGVADGSKYSFYSGASVLLKEGADTSKVDFLVQSHETTESSDADNAKDNVAVAKGKVGLIGAEQLANGAKIIVAGTTFFSDFEVTGDDMYTNVPLTENIIKWMAPAPQAELKTIAEIRKGTGDVPDLKGKKFAIEGIVTAQSEAVQPKNAFFEVIYVQDTTGGITVFGVSQTAVKVGQKVRITGYVDDYQGDYEIAINDEAKDLVVLDEIIKPIEPKKLSTKESMLHENEGLLIKVEGKVSRIEGQNLYIVDDSGKEARAYVEGYIWNGKDESAKGKWDPSIKVGDTVSAVGLGSQDPEGNRLRVRNTDEIVKIANGSDNGNGNNNGGNDNGGNNGGNIEKPVTNTTEEVINAIKNNDTKEVVVDASKNQVVEKAVFDALKGTDKVVTFKVGNVTWTFKGKDINKVMDIDLSLKTVDDTLKGNINKLVEKILDKDAPVFMLSFKYDGELPGKADIKVFMGKEWANKTVTFFRYFPGKGTYEKVQSDVKVDAEGYAVITLDHCSDYFALEQTQAVSSIPQAGAPIGASNLLVFGVAISALGVLLLRKK